MAFNKAYQKKYEDDKWPAYQRIKERNGHKFIKRLIVGKDGHTKFDNLKQGDGVWEFNGIVYNSDLKTCGRLYNGSVTRRSLNNSEFEYYDFFDSFHDHKIMCVSKESLIREFKANNYYVDPKDKLAGNDLIRFNYKLIESISDYIIN